MYVTFSQLTALKCGIIISHNELAISLAAVKICYNLRCVSGNLLFFHQALQVEKESGAEGEEDIGDSQEPLWTIP